ncbi:MAG: signal peptidase II [Tannerella sp.]|jgi:lipoprotein signal peptidase|nr:signal peptidase II [Tannerella sp.]
MRIRTVILWTIVLVVVEQVIKLIISTNYRDINFEIIPSLLEFKPVLNDKSFYWLSLMNIDVGRWARMATAIILTGVLCLYYFCMRTISEKGKLIDVTFIFGFAGLLCSLCDNIFFGGSWDYVYLKPLFIFDLKDLYLNCFVILFMIFCTKNHATIKNVKIKDIVSLAKNKLKQD